MAFPEDADLIPCTLMLLTSSSNSGPRGSDTLSWPLGALQLCGAQTHMQAKPQIHETKTKEKNCRAVEAEVQGFACKACENSPDSQCSLLDMKVLSRTSLPSPLLHSLHRGPPMLTDTPLPCNFICCAAVLLFLFPGLLTLYFLLENSLILQDQFHGS